MTRMTNSFAATAAVGLLVATGQGAHAQSAFRGDCEQAQRFADSLAFKASYSGVQRMTLRTADACGRDVLALYDLKRRNESNANYDLVGRYYYLWPNDASCPEEVHDRLNGMARISQEVRPHGLICEVRLRLDFDVVQDEKYGPNRFSKLITLIGADTSRFAATVPEEAEATVFYEAPARTVDRAAGPADEYSDIVTDRSDLPSLSAASPYAPNRRQFLDRRTGRFYYFDPRRGAYFWENGQPRN